jgi:N-acetylneuraminic acid mutarotase
VLLAFFRPEAPANSSQKTPTFAERVSYQHAIEDVYWRHRIWPKERPDPKPSLDAVMSRTQLEKKVADYLRKSQALANYWEQPITAEELQAEMDRMANHTKQPEVLRELFATLGNDPFVIAECLARPALADHLFQSAMASQNFTLAASQPINSHKRNGVSFSGYRLPRITTLLSPEGTCIDAWGATSTVNAPTARDSHTAVWTGSEMIVWGGADSTSTFNTGGRYNPSTDSWTATSTTNAPTGRLGHTAVWTGSEMIIWGGLQAFPNLFNTGGRYNPATDTWTVTSITNAPAGRTFHTAVWNGSEMIVWGGESSAGYQNTGGRYNPTTDSWTATNTTNTPDARVGHTAVWTGNEMIIWGGDNDSGYLNTGGRYNPGTDSWVATRTTGAPFPRNDHTAVWTGNEMIIWGGDTNSPPYYLNTGGRYNPITDSWVAHQHHERAFCPRVSYSHLDGQRYDCLGRICWQLPRYQHWREIQSEHRQLDSHQHRERARWALRSHGSVDRQ